MKEALTIFLRDIGEQIGAEFYYVGGSVRDEILGIGEPDDFDLVARGLPLDSLMDGLRSFGGVELTGTLFKVIRFHPARREFDQLEIALPRTEVSNGTGHNEWDVMTDHTLTIEQDLVRRDFTCNALAENLHTGELHDPLNGRADIAAGILRAIHHTTFQDDPLRVIRGVRFVAKLGFDVEDTTHTQMVQHSHLLTTVSGERFQMEFLKLLMAPHVGKALRYMRDIGALPHFLPELQAAVGCAQNKWHDHDVFEHLVQVVENTDTHDPYVRLAALLHDIGKPPTRWVGPDGEAHFYLPEEGQEFVLEPQVAGAHEEIGARMAYEIMKRFKFSTWHSDRVAALVREHMFARGPRLSPRVARKLLARLDHVPGGLEANVEALFALRYGDNRGGKVKFSLEGDQHDRSFHDVVREELAKESATTVRDLALNGHDLLALGLRGPAIGEMQRELLELVIDDPEQNTRENLLSYLSWRGYAES